MDGLQAAAQKHTYIRCGTCLCILKENNRPK